MAHELDCLQVLAFRAEAARRQRAAREQLLDLDDDGIEETEGATDDQCIVCGQVALAEAIEVSARSISRRLF